MGAKLREMAWAEARGRAELEDRGEIPLAPIVEWYRVDATRRIGAALSFGAIAMVIGMFMVSGLVFGRDLASAAWGVAGITEVIAGGLATLIGLQRVLSEESYVALRVDGVLLVRPTGWRLVRWEDVEDVRHDRARDAIVLVQYSGSEWTIGERFSGITNADLAKNAATVRRRALFGMYGSLMRSVSI
jgi:hypothetical protein